MSSPAQAPEPWPRSDQQPFDLQLLSPEPGSIPLRGPCLCFAAAAASPVAKGMQLAAAVRLDQVDSPLREADSPGKVWPLSPVLHRQYSRAPRQEGRSFGSFGRPTSSFSSPLVGYLSAMPTICVAWWPGGMTPAHSQLCNSSSQLQEDLGSNPSHAVCCSL
mgnify:CR=1 FL=1